MKIGTKEIMIFLGVVTIILASLNIYKQLKA